MAKACFVCNIYLDDQTVLHLNCNYSASADHSWPRSLRHETSSLARTLGSWFPNPTQSIDACVCLYCLCYPVCR
jgi:hypothetical protein